MTTRPVAKEGELGFAQVERGGLWLPPHSPRLNPTQDVSEARVGADSDDTGLSPSYFCAALGAGMAVTHGSWAVTEASLATLMSTHRKPGPQTHVPRVQAGPRCCVLTGHSGPEGSG
jgi:hypothetical protein